MEHNPKTARECTKCLKFFDTQTELTQHMTEKHSSSEYRCRYCPKRLSQKYSCFQHEKVIASFALFLAHQKLISQIHPNWKPRLDEIDEMYHSTYGMTAREFAASKRTF